jgi:hypothetical protein
MTVLRLPGQGVVIKLNTSDLADDFMTITTTMTTITSLANGSALTRHQAGMSTTMPNDLRGMYLLITSLRG